MGDIWNNNRKNNPKLPIVGYWRINHRLSKIHVGIRGRIDGIYDIEMKKNRKR
jgi:hypothetical protein